MVFILFIYFLYGGGGVRKFLALGWILDISRLPSLRNKLSSLNLTQVNACLKISIKSYVYRLHIN